MAMRSLWKGQLRLSLVSIAVELYSATRTGSRVSFRQIHEPSGKRIKYEKTAEGIGPVDKDDIVKGYEYEKNNYVLLKPEEIEEVKLESKKTFELVQFVEACEIPPLYFDKPYYLVPADDLAQDAYRVVRDALRQTSRVGIGQITLRGQEHLAAVKPCGDGLLLETLHYSDEIRNADPLFSAIKDEAVSEDLLDVATALIEKKTAPFDAAVYKDHYSDALKALIAAKMKSKSGKRVLEENEAPAAGGRQDNVVDLMAALKKSLEGAGKGGTKSANARKSPASKTASSAKSSGAKSSSKQADKTPAPKARKKRA
ncbi:Ku protein [Allohahella marinimesophila]|uniref:Non-homologous end joining protein Ku n=1 Tax=Allohahella marinimesophila TaxID=1054972 RepID=A0ABP7PFS1_9GAMM